MYHYFYNFRMKKQPAHQKVSHLQNPKKMLKPLLQHLLLLQQKQILILQLSRHKKSQKLQLNTRMKRHFRKRFRRRLKRNKRKKGMLMFRV